MMTVSLGCVAPVVTRLPRQKNLLLLKKRQLPNQKLRPKKWTVQYLMVNHLMDSLTKQTENGLYIPLMDDLFGTRHCLAGTQYLMMELFTRRNLMFQDTTRSAGLALHQLLVAVVLLHMRQMMTGVTNQARTCLKKKAKNEPKNTLS